MIYMLQPFTTARKNLHYRESGLIYQTLYYPTFSFVIIFMRKIVKEI